MNGLKKPDRPAKERDPGRNREIMPEEGQKIIDYVFDGILKPDIAFLLDTDIQKAYNRMLLRNSISKEEITSKEVLKIMEHYYKNEFFFYPFTKIGNPSPEYR